MTGHLRRWTIAVRRNISFGDSPVLFPDHHHVRSCPGRGSCSPRKVEEALLRPPAGNGAKVEANTSPLTDASNRRRGDSFLSRCPRPSALIEVCPLRDRTLSGWLRCRGTQG